MKTIPWRKTALWILSLVLLLAGCAGAPEPKLTPLTVAALRVGKADALIVTIGSHTLVIDAGEEDDGQEVVDYLQKHGISAVDAMIITHFDKDHVGGADTVLEQIPVQEVFVPDYDGTGTEYADFLLAAEAAAVPVMRLTENRSFPLGDAEVLIEPPASCEIPAGSADYDNNFSLITTVTHGKNRLVFMGDAEKQRIREWMEGGSAIPCDFLKVPHHGVYNRALEELFPALTPKAAVICSSQKHPADPKTLELLGRSCPEIFETRDGDVLVISDGQQLEIHQKTTN